MVKVKEVWEDFTWEYENETYNTGNYNISTHGPVEHSDLSPLLL